MAIPSFLKSLLRVVSLIFIAIFCAHTVASLMGFGEDYPFWKLFGDVLSQIIFLASPVLGILRLEDRIP